MVFQLPSALRTRYRLQEQLGEGAFGSVWRISDSRSIANRYKALKIVPTDDLGKDELSIYSKLQGCDRVVQLFWSKEVDDDTFLFLELSGPSLDTLLTAHSADAFSKQTTLLLCAEMLSCAEQIHSRGIIHRDIKPANFTVKFGRKVSLKVIDFSISADSSKIRFRTRAQRRNDIQMDGHQMGYYDVGLGGEWREYEDVYAVLFCGLEMRNLRNLYYDANREKTMEKKMEIRDDPATALRKAKELVPLATELSSQYTKVVKYEELRQACYKGDKKLSSTSVIKVTPGGRNRERNLY